MTRCMIVDGSSVVRKVAKRILADNHETIAEAASGAEAIADFAAEQPDIVLVDSELDDMDVIHFISEIRTGHGDTAKIIVMMTEFDLVQMTKAKRAGANEYLLKPFDRDKLSRFLGYAEAA